MIKPYILIPTYNHHKCLEQIIQGVSAFELDILIVNDGSNLETEAELEKIKTRHHKVTIITLSENQGKGAAVVAGFKWGSKNGYTHALQIDADGQHDIGDLQIILALAKENPNDLILGQPAYDESIPKLRFYSRYITHFWVFMETFSTKVGDTMCGFRCYPLEQIDKLLQKTQLTKRMDFDIEIAVRLHWQGCKIKHFMTKVSYADREPSNFKAFRDNLNISMVHTKLFLIFILSVLPGKLLAKIFNNQNSHWMLSKERGSVLGIRFMLTSIKYLGRRASIAILYPIIVYFFLTGKKERKASLHYLQKVHTYFGVDSPFKSKPNLYNCYKHFLEFGISAIDKALVWQNQIHLENLQWKKQISLPEYHTQDKGLIILGAHLGNMEILRSLATTKRNFKINAIVYTEHAKKFNAILKSISKDVEVNLIHVNEITIETSISLKEKIDQGECLAILSDRTPLTSKQRTLTIPFLGEPANFPQGPIILASLMDCPVYTLTCLRNKEKQYDVYLEKLSEKIILPRKNREEVVEEYLTTYVERLTHCIRQAPYQWYTFHNIWEKN